MTGFEPLIGAATAGLAGLIGNVIKEKGGDLLTKADIDLFKGREFNQAIQKYVRRYADRHGSLKVACVRMDSPVKLDEIYTAVQLLPRSALRYYESTESLEDLYRASGKRGFNFHDAEKKQGIEVANDQQYLMVLGGPGGGKSTFLRKMGLEALRRQAIMKYAQQNPEQKPQEHYYGHDCIPVMLELRQFNSKDLKIEDVIAQEFEVCGFPKAQEFTELFLKSGKLLVMLDGLDEVPTDTLNHAITQIENLVDRYDDNRFIASCRVAAYTFGGFKRFKEVAMAAFEDSQIERFINNWFQKPKDIEAETAKRCWELLDNTDYQAAKELAQTPLLLTLLCVIYDDYQDFPRKRCQVYGDALDVLLRKWAAEKRILKEPIYQKFGSDLELELLSELAYNSFVDNQLFFPKQTVLNHIQDFQAENENAPEVDAGKILTEIEVQQGILVERSRQTYSFSHLTFQEYLTAKFIVDNQRIDNLVDNHLTDQRWREVFLLVAGLAPGKSGAESLLSKMERAARQELTSENLHALVSWADCETQYSPGGYKRGAKRAAALALKHARARAHASDLERTRSLASIRGHYHVRALDLARALARALDLDLDLTRDLDRTHAHEYLKLGIFEPTKMELLIQRLNAFDSLEDYEDYFKFSSEIWKDAVNLSACFLDISEVEIKALIDCYSATELMIRCKEAAVRVSSQVWEEIESRILTVPTD